MEEITRALDIARTLGVTAGRAETLTGGNENHVVRVHSTGGDIVVRIAREPDPGDDSFDVEAWCLRAAARAGVRTSQLVARGHLQGVSYLVTTFLPGAHADPEDLRGWRAIGEFAAALRSVPTDDAPDALFSRFGRDLTAAWDQHLAFNREALTADDPLIGLGVHPAERRGELADVVDAIAERDLPQGLVHGDLAHRNLLRHGAQYTVIDWGTACVEPVLWGDLERIYRWHRLGSAESPVSAAAWNQVLDGAGLTPADAEPVVRDLAVLHALDLVRWAVDRRPERLREIVRDARRVLAVMLPPPPDRGA